MAIALKVATNPHLQTSKHIEPRKQGEAPTLFTHGKHANITDGQELYDRGEHLWQRMTYSVGRRVTEPKKKM